VSDAISRVFALEWSSRSLGSGRLTFRAKTSLGASSTATIVVRSMRAMAEMVSELRRVLVDLLSQGNWDTIETDHLRVGLAWREDLGAGWGKPKHVKARPRGA
jgi:hypothetical protein